MKDRIVVAILMFILCPLGGNLLAQENPKTAEAHYKQAEELLKKNQDAKAIVEATQAIKLKPNYWEAYSVRGMAYARTRAFDKAIADLSEAIRLNPTDPNGYKNRAVTYGMKGDKEKALADQEAVNRLLAK